MSDFSSQSRLVFFTQFVKAVESVWVLCYECSLLEDRELVR